MTVSCRSPICRCEHADLEGGLLWMDSCLTRAIGRNPNPSGRPSGWRKTPPSKVPSVRRPMVGHTYHCIAPAQSWPSVKQITLFNTLCCSLALIFTSTFIAFAFTTFALTAFAFAVFTFTITALCASAPYLPLYELRPRIHHFMSSNAQPIETRASPDFLPSQVGPMLASNQGSSPASRSSDGSSTWSV
ncbi:hypothetical protein CDL15_Pgr023989 [Punica granatum]|uniref:Uncharacterized protein n=1 Tax=Punica granatum TaxID=22663 RepID=A0A218XUK4_PUNGR|nr:hypothetical protein CDL15_Pgr023989 [Punica granatum]PKI59695.1 hypothetical protein CRG98_019871 [Punica granatum]